jgi:hypothetical protein
VRSAFDDWNKLHNHYDPLAGCADIKVPSHIAARVRATADSMLANWSSCRKVGRDVHSASTANFIAFDSNKLGHIKGNVVAHAGLFIIQHLDELQPKDIKRIHRGTKSCPCFDPWDFLHGMAVGGSDSAPCTLNSSILMDDNVVDFLACVDLEDDPTSFVIMEQVPSELFSLQSLCWMTSQRFATN